MIASTSVKAPRILVIRGGAIGDFILTLPVLAALRDRFPRADIEVLGYPRVASLALTGGLAKAVHAIESPGLASFFATTGDPSRRNWTASAITAPLLPMVEISTASHWPD